MSLVIILAHIGEASSVLGQWYEALALALPIYRAGPFHTDGEIPDCSRFFCNVNVFVAKALRISEGNE